MLWHTVAATTVLLAVHGQEDYADPSYEHSRRGSVDEDVGYEYDYSPGNSLGPSQTLVALGDGGIRREPERREPERREPERREPERREPERREPERREHEKFREIPSRHSPLPSRQSFKPRPSDNGYKPRPRTPSGLVGKEACKSGSKTTGHESSCDLYYDCYEGQGFLQECPNGLVYVNDGRFGLIGQCDYPHNIECGNTPERNPPQSTEHCDWLYGIFGHETSCTRYWTCWNGTATEQFCIGGLLYNEETHACDWPQNVAGCQKHPLCKDDANGNVPLGKSCNRYWACQGGYPRLQRCPAMLVFDKDRKRCVTPPTEDCEVPTTSAPQPGDDNFNDGSYDGDNGNGNQSQNPRRGSAAARRRPLPAPTAGALPLDAAQDRSSNPFNIPPGSN